MHTKENSSTKVRRAKDLILHHVIPQLFVASLFARIAAEVTREAFATPR